MACEDMGLISYLTHTSLCMCLADSLLGLMMNAAWLLVCFNGSRGLRNKLWCDSGNYN